jgi:flagellar protein FliS
MQRHTHPAIASQHYRTLDLQSRVQSASPHGLVSLLYEELLRAIDLAIVKTRAGSDQAYAVHTAKAIAILVALESSLDSTKGGTLALTLARIYRACSQGLREATKLGDLEKLTEIREAISQIAYAWQALSDT